MEFTVHGVSKVQIFLFLLCTGSVKIFFYFVTGRIAAKRQTAGIVFTQ